MVVKMTNETSNRDQALMLRGNVSRMLYMYEDPYERLSHAIELAEDLGVSVAVVIKEMYRQHQSLETGKPIELRGEDDFYLVYRHLRLIGMVFRLDDGRWTASLSVHRQVGPVPCYRKYRHLTGAVRHLLRVTRKFA
jgi:hypothetical protein